MGMKRQYNVVIEQDEDGFLLASVPELHGCHTQAKSLDVLMERIREAIELCIEVEGQSQPRARFVGMQMVEV